LRLEPLEDRDLPSIAPVGPQFRVNMVTAAEQRTFFETPQAVALNPTTGDYVATWSSINQDGSGWGVYARRYNAAGVPQGGEFRVNATTAGNQQFSSVAVDAAGNFVVTWSSENQDGSGWGVYARRYNAAGVPQGGEFRVNSTTSNDQQWSTIAVDGAGNFVVTWTSRNQDGDDWGVYAQRYDAAGGAQGGEFRVNSTTTDAQQFSRVAVDPAGNFVITWSSWDQDGDEWGVYAQRYDAAGTPLGGEFRVNSTTSQSQQHSAVAMDTAGNFVVTWSSDDQDGDDWGVYARRYDNAGTPLGGEFRVNSTTDKDQRYSTVAADAAGNFVITWSSEDQDSGGSWGVYARRYDSAGTPLGGEFRVNSTTTNDQELSSVATDAGGDFVVVWRGNGFGDGSGVYGQRFGVPAAIQVSPTAGSSTTEAGGTATFGVVLNSQPVADVTIGLSTSDGTEGTVSVPSLTFTPTDWDIVQTVTVTGADDLLADGNVTYTIITAAAVSADPDYNGLDAADVALTNNDNETAGITVTPTQGLGTTEAGGTATFSVVLNAAPLLPVTVPLSVSDPSEGSLSTTSLTFSLLNWNTPQFVTVTGLDDTLDDGNVAYTVVTGTVVTLDLFYLGMNPLDVAVTNFDNDGTGITVIAPVNPMTTEAGGTTSFAVVLDSQPIADVTITLGSSDPTEGTLSTTTLTFTPANWDTPQPVTVTGVDDVVDDGDSTYTVIIAGATSTDPGYDGLDAADVVLVNTDDDTAGITVTAASGLVTTEAGGTAAFTVALNSQPVGDVVIALTTSDATEGTLSTTLLTFTPADWNIAQTVTVTGVDDAVDDGDITFTVVTAAATSADVAYDGLDAADVTATNVDDDTIGITVTPVAGLTTTAQGGTATFSVVLNSQPVGDVTITLSSSDPGQGTASPAGVTFTPANWNVAQVVTVTGVDNGGPAGDVAYQVITAAAVSSDLQYHGLNPADVDVVNQHPPGSGVVPPGTVPPGTVPPGIVPPDIIGGDDPGVGGGGNPVQPVNPPLDEERPDRETIPGNGSGTPGTDSEILPGGGAIGRRNPGLADSSRRYSGGGVPATDPDAEVPSVVRVDPGVDGGGEEALSRETVPEPATEPVVAVTPGPVVPPVMAIMPQLEVARQFQTGVLWEALDTQAEQTSPRSGGHRAVDVLFATGVVATAGYIFLSSRVGFLLLSALAARPLWKQFDPLDILFAWEEEKKRRRQLGTLPEPGEEEEETLQSLVT
jgi:hypothetical protein